VLFLRSRGGDDPAACLWVYDVETATDRLLFDPRQQTDPRKEELPDAERSRRERLREIGAGLVAYALDDAHATASFALSGRLFVVDVGAATATELPTAGPVLDPRLDPTGRRIAYLTGRALHVVDRDGRDQLLAADDDEAVSWGAVDFIAAEEFGRSRGYWWTPDGERLIVARVDESAVTTWHIGDPSDPEKPPTLHRYPRAGTANADVGLHIITMGGVRVEVQWDHNAFPYLLDVRTTNVGTLVVLLTRDQRCKRTLSVDLETGTTEIVHEQTDTAWVEHVPGVPAYLGDGQLVTTVDADDTRRLALNGTPVTPIGLQVTSVDVGAEDVVLVATDDPTERHVWRLQAASGELTRLSREPGVHAAVRGGGLFVLVSASMDRHGASVTLMRNGAVVGEITSYAEEPSVVPRVTFLTTGRREIRTGVLLPSGHERGTSLPVLLDPYGGPHGPRVLRSRQLFLAPQWFADQGFAVVVADGRGTPARGPAWERAILDDWATTVVDDQVDALHGVAETHPDIDLSRVAIRGWSFGGYLAALAVLRRPDVFHAAIAGAPVTDWSLYDTAYTERYLGLPQDDRDRYAAASPITDADKLRRPLMLIHGLADDNVVAAHTLRFSEALLAAGRPHMVLPLSRVTHMTPQEAVAENLLLLQLAFLRDALSPGSIQGFAG
jgi:dipeptidyl-peptidase-4